MEKKFQIYDLAVHKSAYVKYENALKEYFEKNNINRDKDVQELYLPSLDLKELRPLERFKNLNILWLQSNQLKTLPFIQNCFNLTEIYLQNNLIQSIENMLRNLYNLNVLFLQANQITDINLTIKELSYLKHLRNLNLFDNPICLEKNYRYLLVYHIPSLAILDRNTVKPNERNLSIKKFEPERVSLNKKISFMRYYDALKSTKLDNELNFSKCESIASFNLSLSDRESPFKHLKRSKTDFISSPSNRKIKSMFHSTKEYSFFDWSKVDLYENKSYFEPEQTKSNQNETKIVQLPQIVTLRFT